MKKFMSALIIVGMLACSIALTSGVFAIVTSGGLIWKKTPNPSSDYDAAFDASVYGSSVYIVGTDSKPGATDNRWRIEKRSLTDGSLIWKKTPNPSSSYDQARDVAVDDTGVYTVGYDEVPDTGDYRWRIEKRDHSDGSLDWKKVSNPSGGTDQAYSVAVYGTGVYIVGYDQKPGVNNRRWRIERRSTTDGSLIWKETPNPSSSDDYANSVAVDGTGVYIVGYDKKPGDYRWRIEKRDPSDGSLIWKKFSNPSIYLDSAQGVAVDSSGVYIVGFDQKPGSGDRRWRIEKRDLNDGSLFWTKFSNPSGLNDQAYDVVSDGTSVYIVGYDNKPGDYRWRIEKRDPSDGSRIWAKTSNPSSGFEKALGMTVEGSAIYIVGYDYTTVDARWRIEKRQA